MKEQTLYCDKVDKLFTLACLVKTLFFSTFQVFFRLKQGLLYNFTEPLTQVLD